MSLANFKNGHKEQYLQYNSLQRSERFFPFKETCSCCETRKKRVTIYTFYNFQVLSILLFFSYQYSCICVSISVLKCILVSHWKGLSAGSILLRKAIFDYLGNLFVSVECQHFVLEWTYIGESFFGFWEVTEREFHYWSIWLVKKTIV